jgi:hypothetical protein
MLVMAVLLLAGTTFLTISSTESQIALNERAAAQALMLAEAGISKALAQLSAAFLSGSSYTGETSALAGGTFTVTVATSAIQTCPGNSAKDLVVTATVPVSGGQAQVQAAATADQISYPYRWAAFAAVPNTVVMSPNQMIFGADRTESELWLKDSVTADSFDSSLGPYDATTNSGSGGNVGGNGDVTLGNSVQVRGSVRAGDAIHAGSGDVISGGQVSSLSPNLTSPGEPLPSVTPAVPLTTSLTSPGATFTLTSGNLTVTSGTLTFPASGSPYYFSSMTFGDDTVLATTGGPVTVYASGPVTLGERVTFGANPGGQLRIILKSDGSNLESANFTANHDFHLYGSLYGKNTNIDLDDHARVYGSVIGRTVVVQGGSALHFDQAMTNQEICHSGMFAIRRGSWREVIP